MSMSRRTFLGTSAAAVLAAGTMTKGKVFGANEKIGACVMGVNGRGGAHYEAFTKSPDSEVVALCDVDEKVLEEAAHRIEKVTSKRPKTYTDIREALNDKAVHVLGIATPNHWHSLAAIWAVQAGKDVYVEKPLSHEVWEGRQLAEAAKQTGRIVQHGTQSRSEASWRRDLALLQSGEIIGPLYMARALCYKRRDAVPIAQDQDPPAHLHWRLWQGPASEKPYNPMYVHYNWHWFWHYGNGDIGNQGVHQMDIAVWGLNKGLPVRVFSAGGRYTYEDACETPNTQVATFTYADGTLLQFEVRGRWTNKEEDVCVGNLFYGQNGYYVGGKGFFDADSKPIVIDESKYPKPEDINHFQHFLNVVKSRKQEDIHGNALEGHISSAHCHLANIAYRIGRTLEFDPQTETFKKAKDANKLLRRKYHPDFTVPAFT
ncbi:MAG TPA: Gfo/Idh/MocA family oxidoreductase [Candidatus Hydrogenedentes bacterium]|nr:Gfo/Idh/MocA family oxidoreductase [Candidatus Hydrogenedentota bacterium]